MIFDKQNLFMDKTAFTTAIAADVVQGDVIDLWSLAGDAGATVKPNAAMPVGVNGPIGGPLAAYIDPGKGGEVEVVVQVTTALTGGGTGTFQLKLVMADNAALTTNPVVLSESPAITVDAAGANLPAGYQFKFVTDLPPGTTKRYIGLKSTVVTAVLTAGAATAGIVADRATSHAV